MVYRVIVMVRVRVGLPCASQPAGTHRRPSVKDQRKGLRLWFVLHSHLSYADSEKELGVHIHKSFTFNEQCEILLIKANQKFSILKRTCHFVTCKNRQRVIYLALVRSQFEYCSPVWRSGSITMMNKFESFQKNALSGFSLRRKNLTLMRFI